MAKKQTAPTKVESIRHKDKRANIPTEELRDFVTDEELAPKTMRYTDADGKTRRVAVTSSLQLGAVESYARTIAQKLQDSLDQDTDEWKALIPGRPLLSA